MEIEYRNNLINWLIFIFLSIIWGSSFILMKFGLNEFSSYQVASLRIISSGLVFSPLAIKHLKLLKLKQISLIVLSGFFGNFMPAYLFCIAETRIDSSTAGIVNSLMPIFTIIIGIVFFKLKVNFHKIIGVIISFIGLLLLILNASSHLEFNIFFLSLAIIATISYGFNSNFIASNLKEVKSIQIISISMLILSIPSLLIIIFSDFFTKINYTSSFFISLASSITLGVINTAIASWLFYILIKRTGSIFSSLVTNTMPIVAVILGSLNGERITYFQIIGLFIILLGVYFVNNNSSLKSKNT